MTFAKSISAPARIVALALALTAGFAASGARAHDGHVHGEAKTAADAAKKAEDHSGHKMQSEGHGNDSSQMDHSGHQAEGTADHRMPDHLGMDDGNSVEMAMSPDGFQYMRSENDYVMPSVTLRNQQAQKVNFADLMAYDGPVVLNFIFTSCATICPVMSATFGQTQDDLAAIDDSYMMVSISIDPDYDTPRRLRDYAELHAARDNWVMLTGQFDDIFTVVRAFDAVYKGENKMYHRPLTFLRQGKDMPWLRLEGLLGSEELAEEYAALLRPEVN